jgi:NADPH:quinone reductase-like Zn-dependent oxidoreductase
MRAVAFSSYGPPDVLRLIDVADPDIGAGQVRVRVKAAGVQPFDARFRGGLFRGYVPARFPQTLGGEFAGVIDRVGEGVTELVPGDEVLGYVWQAAYAERVVVGVDEVVAKPPGMPWAEAGALSASGQTAHTALRELGVGAGETVLIHAAAGGVGSVAVQLGRAWGATVVGTASEGNHDYLRSLGAIPVAYGEGLVDRVRMAAPRGVDAALDAHGGEEAIGASVALVADRDRVGTLTGRDAAARLGIRLIGTQRSADRLAELVALWEQGGLRVHVRRTFPLERAADAHREVETGHGRGKVVLTVDGDPAVEAESGRRG